MKPRSLSQPGDQSGPEAQAVMLGTSGYTVGETVLPSAGLGQVLSNAALPSGARGPSFRALMLPGAAASTISELGLCRVCGQVLHGGEGCAYVFRRAWANQGR